ncbi:hypothetical protein KGA66_09755 [Actinocrinis puniceicyclus]|uniref:Teneurin-like YD-shell domain-containing protein n=1 Tax=Actinocrinis puniceicyclus TaxID=977794 RepID=A0A8J7WPT9_9ACTN|nr:RHS repeat-associated core domain-containing protein [Actinocrinis puniceicyclus]MBS2963330.1 hypothetical protein [Actinocrinis puniceicyclus]
MPAPAAKSIPAPPPIPAEKQIPYSLQSPGKARALPSFPKFDPTVDSRLPAAGSATVDLNAATPAPRADGAFRTPSTNSAIAPKRAGTLPVLVGRPAAGAKSTAPSGPSRVAVTLTDQKSAQAAGIHGILFTLAVAPGSTGTGPVTVSVDDSTFSAAFGGDYAARLHLVRLPSCALTTPRLAACQVQTPIAALGRDPLSARIDLGAHATVKSHTTAVAAHPIPAASPGAVVLGLTSGSSGPSGTYAATPLSPAGTWSMGGNTGSFDYSYPIQVPAAIGGGAPNVDLSYDSSSQDGRTEGTNNQSSWIGDGWSSTESYVERSYENCSDETTSGAPQYSGDECWAGQVLTLSLNGESTQIVYDAGAKTFRPVNDSSTTKIEQLTNCTNGTYNNECWRVTENGTQYYFGLNRLPGWASGDTASQSAWTVPVYCGPDVPTCTSSNFASSSKLMGWRWNLDYVVDVHDNAAAYYYTAELNNYGADMQTTPVKYTRGGYLNRIDYGMTASTVYSTAAPERIVFNTAERCIPGTPSGNTCADSQFTVADASYWPDVPIDQDCWTLNTSSCPNHGPTFWSRKRLTSIVTQVQVGGATKQADEYDFTQTFPDGGDHAPTLWLDSILHTGLDTTAGATTSVPDPPVSFDPPLQLPNRVGTIPSVPVMYHDRIHDIKTETGAKITVSYNPTTCTTSNVPSDPSTNTMPCFPVYWTPYGAAGPELDWFQKYTVQQVETQDQNNTNPDGSYPDLLTTYKYDGGAAWHYDDNEVVKSKNRTYGQFRGYATVETVTGNPNVFHLTNGTKVYDQQSLTKTTYLRGMDSDTPTGTGGTAVTVTSLDGKYSVTDSNALAGKPFETDTYTDATGTTLYSAAVNAPTIIGPTATRTRTGLPPLTAQMVRTANTYTRTAVSYSPGWRYTETDDFYNTTLGTATTGNPIQADDRGEIADPHNIPKCTWTRYIESADGTLVLPAEVITNAQDCTAAGATPTGPLISDARTSYDSNAFTWDGTSPAGTAPTKGDVTATEQAVGPTGAVTASAFVTMATSSYDTYGRVISVTRTPNSSAPNGSSLAQITTTSYSPASGALPTQVQTQTQVTPGASMNPCTAPACQSATTTMDPVRALPTEKIDAAGLKTDYTYDALGRVTAVWLPNEAKSAGMSANYTYSYTLSQTAPEVVTTNRLLESGGYVSSETLYDAMLRTRETQQTSENSSNTVSDTQYNSLGKPVLTENAYNVAGSPSTVLVTNVPQGSIPDASVTDYDAMARPDLATEEHDGAKSWTTTTAYAGDHTTVIPPSGGMTQTTYTDARGQTSELDQYTSAPTLSGTAQSGFTVTGGTTNVTKYTYTASAKQATVTGPDSKVWSFTYDLSGRKTQQSDPDAGASTHAYDDAGNLVSTTDSRGIELDYTYDLLGRKLTATDKHAAGFEYASWLYDTLQVGKLTSSTRYVSGVTGGYTVASTGYTSLGKPVGTTITLPSVESPLPTTYTTTYSYSTNDQLMTGQTDPRTVGLSGEALTYGVDTLGNPVDTSSGSWTYVTGTVYTNYGEPSRLTLGPSTNPAYVTYTYDDETRRLTDVLTSRTQAPGPTVDDTSYTYDPAGNPTSTTDKQSETGNTVTDTQCYQYNPLDELTRAWTDTAGVNSAGVGGVGGCKTTTPSSATLATGTAAYWQSYAYDATGDRRTETDHTATTSTTTTYTNGGTPSASCANTSVQPHALTSVSTGTATTSFCYDKLGDTVSRTPSTGSAQTLAWDDEDHLQSVTQSTNITGYLYDADGNQLIRRDPGQTTLFAGDTEIVVNTAVTPHTLLGAVRSYHIGGTGPVIAVRSSLPGKSGVDYQLTDSHATATLEMDTNTQAVSRTQYAPYGQVRGTASSSWIDPTRGYLGQPADTSTGYTDLGARKYDPTLGRFISIDPVLETGDSRQLGGYTYAADNPSTGADPNGLRAMGDAPGSSCDWNGDCSSPSASGSPGQDVEVGGGVFVNTNNAHFYQLQNWGIRIAFGTHEVSGSQTVRTQEAMRDWLGLCTAHSDVCGQTMLAALQAQVKAIGTFDVGTGGSDPLLVSASGGATLLRGADTTKGDEYAAALGAQAYGEDPRAIAMLHAGIALAFESGYEYLSAKAGAGGYARGGGSCANSFIGTTLVLMADGSSKPIDQIHVGDKISNAQPGAPFGAKDETHIVTAVHITYTDRDYTDVTVSSAHGTFSATGNAGLGDAVVPALGTATITGTAHHLYWDATTRSWTEADRLRAGDQLQTTNGHTVTILAIHDYTTTTVTYNLTIDSLHTYYVEAGSTPVLVHNAGPGCGTGRSLWQLTKDGASAMKRGGPFNTTFYKSASDGTWCNAT